MRNLIVAAFLVLSVLPASAEIAWRYDKESKYLIDPAGEAVPTGKLGELLVGANTTLARPPALEDGKWPKFDPKTGTWAQVPLYVGRTVYDKATKNPMRIEYEKHGNAIPDGYTELAPPGNCEFCEWDESSQTWPENTAKKDAAAEEIARLKAISDDQTRKDLRDKLESATVGQMRNYVHNLFPSLNEDQQEFLVGLLLLAR